MLDNLDHPEMYPEIYLCIQKKKEKKRKTASQGEVETEQGWREEGESGDGKKKGGWLDLGMSVWSLRL